MKPLKILLGNNSLSILGGSETWTYTLALQLKAMGHDVSCFASDLGIISKKLIDAGVPCYDDLTTNEIRPFSFVLEEEIDHKYDVIIANHFHIVEYLRSQFPITPIISTVHGIIHFVEDKGEKIMAPEHPALSSGVAQFISVSEEVRKKLKDDYNIDSKIIRNFFDLKKFPNISPITVGKPKQLLINTNYNGPHDPEIEVLREVAKHYGAKLAAIGANFSQTFDIDKALEDSDVVFGMGRSVLEGVAAGRLAIVHGRWGTGGVICEDTIDELKEFNFSGRNAKGKIASKDEIICMIDDYYNQETIDWGKTYMARDHNVIHAADEYIRLSRELTGQDIIKMQKPSAIASDTKPFKLAKNNE